MSGEIGPVVQRLYSEKWASEPGRGWRTYRLQTQEVCAVGGEPVSAALNAWLAGRQDVVVVSIQYVSLRDMRGAIVGSALILYREGVPADGAGSE